jgi:hypothetical protein
MLWLLVRGALGRLGDAENVVAFSFKRLTSTTRACRRAARSRSPPTAKSRTCAMPLEFRVLEGRLALLKPPDAAQDSRDASAA